MTTPITPTQAEQNIISANIEQEEDIQSLDLALGNIKGMSPGEALMALLMVMGEHTMLVQQDAVNIDSQNLNMMTSLGQISTAMTNDLNGISPTNPIASTQVTPWGPAQNPWAPGSNNALAFDLQYQSKQLSDLFTQPGAGTVSWKDPVTGQEEHLTWMTSSMVTQTNDSLTSFMNLISGGNPSSVSSIVSTINGWISDPTTGTPTGQQQIQKAKSGLMTLSSTFSGLSQSASNIVKEENTILTQYQSALASLFTSYGAQNKAMVANLRAG